METRPPELIEAIVAKLLPAACRENVLGDLHERYRSTAHYILDALRAVPFVVASQSRRNFRSDLFWAEGWVLQIGYSFNPYNGQILPAWILIGLTLLALRILDAYVPADSATLRQIYLKSAMATSFAFLIGFLSNKLGLGPIPQRLLALDQAMWNVFMISSTHSWFVKTTFAKTTTPIAAELAPRLQVLHRLSQEKERKAWCLSFAWLTAALFVFLLNNSWEPATRSHVAWVIIGVVSSVFLGIGQFSNRFERGNAGNDPYGLSLDGKQKGLRIWNGCTILIALFVAYPVVLLSFDLALRQRLQANVTVLGWIKLAALVALLPSWVYVRKTNERATRTIQNEIDVLASLGKKEQ